MDVAPMPGREQCGWAVLRSLLAFLSCGSALAVLSRAKSSVLLGTVVTAGCGVLGDSACAWNLGWEMLDVEWSHVFGDRWSQQDTVVQIHPGWHAGRKCS